MHCKLGNVFAPGRVWVQGQVFGLVVPPSEPWNLLSYGSREIPRDHPFAGNIRTVEMFPNKIFGCFSFFVGLLFEELRNSIASDENFLSSPDEKENKMVEDFAIKFQHRTERGWKRTEFTVLGAFVPRLRKYSVIVVVEEREKKRQERQRESKRKRGP